MDLGAFLLILSVLILVALYVSRPFTLARGEEPASGVDDQDRRRSELLAQYEQTIGALQELDFDQALGKVPAEDYPLHRAELLTNGAEILKKLDAFQAEKPSGAVEDRIEEAIAARRADHAQGKISPGTAFSHVAAAAEADPIEAMVAARRQNRQEKSGGFCPRCGRPVMKSDRFCPHCGMTLGK